MFEMISDFLVYIGKTFCACFNFNGGDFVYLKLRAFDVHIFIWTSKFLKLSTTLDGLSRTTALGRATTLSQSGNCFESSYQMCVL